MHWSPLNLLGPQLPTAPKTLRSLPGAFPNWHMELKASRVHSRDAIHPVPRDQPKTCHLNWTWKQALVKSGSRRNWEPRLWRSEHGANSNTSHGASATPESNAGDEPGSGNPRCGQTEPGLPNASAQDTQRSSSFPVVPRSARQSKPRRVIDFPLVYFAQLLLTASVRLGHSETHATCLRERC